MCYDFNGDCYSNAKDIYRLRREGRLDEARELAESLLKSGRDENDVVRKAYLWTMIDLYNRKVDDGDEGAAKLIADLLSPLPDASGDKFTLVLNKKSERLSLP